MGHVWCEVWQDHTGTASVLENVEQEVKAQNIWKQMQKGSICCLIVIGILLLLLGLVILQAWIRTIQKRRRCKMGLTGKKVQFIYQNLYEMAEFLHPSGADPLSIEGKQAVKEALPELEETDLTWVYDKVMCTMFYEGCDIRDGERMYCLYEQCRKKYSCD